MRCYNCTPTQIIAFKHTPHCVNAAIHAFKDIYSTTSISSEGLILSYINTSILAFKDIHRTPSINSSYSPIVKHQIPPKQTNVQIKITRII